MDDWVKSHTVKVGTNKAIRTFDQAGGMVHCYSSTGDCEISTNGQSWAPFVRGIKMPLPFSRLFFRSASNSAETLEIVTASRPEAYVDQRELAAQVAVDGGIVTNTAPLTDHGGSIQKVGTSTYFAEHIGPVGHQTVTIIDGGANLSGITIRKIRMDIRVSAGGLDLNEIQTTAPSSSPLVERAAGLHETETELFLPAGAGLQLFIINGATIRVYVNYEIG